MKTEDFVTVGTYSDHLVAELIIAALENAGIKTHKFGEQHSMLPTEYVEIKVHETDVERAREIIASQETGD